MFSGNGLPLFCLSLIFLFFICRNIIWTIISGSRTKASVSLRRYGTRYSEHYLNQKQLEKVNNFVLKNGFCSMVRPQCLGDLNIVFFPIVLSSPLSLNSMACFVLWNDSPSLACQDGIDSIILSVWNELIVSVFLDEIVFYLFSLSLSLHLLFSQYSFQRSCKFSQWEIYWIVFEGGHCYSCVYAPRKFLLYKCSSTWHSPSASFVRVLWLGVDKIIGFVNVRLVFDSGGGLTVTKPFWVGILFLVSCLSS